jgi:hypothetical protein
MTPGRSNGPTSGFGFGDVKVETAGGKAFAQAHRTEDIKNDRKIDCANQLWLLIMAKWQPLRSCGLGNEGIDTDPSRRYGTGGGPFPTLPPIRDLAFKLAADGESNQRVSGDRACGLMIEWIDLTHVQNRTSPGSCQ